MTRAPLVLMNTDAVPGAVNALLCRFAAANAIAFPGTDLPRAHLTGTPVRPELGSFNRSSAARHEARSMLGLPIDRQTVAVFGGSLGARRINVAASRARQQMWVVYSVEPDRFPEDDLRGALIRHCRDAGAVTAPPANLLDACESQFERDVLERT